MKTRTITLCLAYAALLGATTDAAVAQVPDNDAYLFDSRGVVARSGFGLCWRTNYWTPAKAIAECDPDLVKKPDAPKVAAMPAPAPAPMPAPAPVVKKCDFIESLAADATFAFGKSALTPAAKKQLDGVAAKAGQCASVASIAVTGHTDRIGSAKSNQALSERRAAAVKSYLESKGLKSITSAGVANTQSMANVNCTDKMAHKKLVACLAPDRRVVVDVRGAAK